MKEKNFISAVVYIHNDASFIKGFHTFLYSQLDAKFENSEIIYVNDASTDNSIKIIENIVLDYNNSMTSIINMSVFQGIELSMNAGADLAIGDFVFEFDSLNLDYDNKLLAEVYHQTMKGFDIVSASPLRKIRLSSRLFYSIFNRFSYCESDLKTERFRLISRRAINRIKMRSNKISYRKAVYSICGLKSKRLYFNPKNNYLRKIHHHRKNRWETAIDSLVLFTNVAYKTTFTLTIIMLIMALSVGIYALVLFLSHTKPIEGWTTSMIFLSGGFSGIFFLFGVVIKYLSIVVDLSFNNDIHLVESVKKL